MSNRRLLIVDDSAIMRRAVAAAFANEPGIDVVGAASNGRVALMKVPLLRPDVVVLDIDTPEGDGLETLAAIRRIDPRLKIIVLNVATPAGAAATLGSLIHGAADYVVKPEAEVPSDAALKTVCDELVLKVAASGEARAERDAARSAARGVPQRPVSAPAPAPARVDVVVIGISTGGPSALMEIIPTLPADFPVPILIVQHMPPQFTKMLADRLAATSRIAVAEGRSSCVLAPGHAWIAPGDFHMEVKREGDAVTLVTQQDPPENSCRPAVDVLFRSVAKVYGPNVLAVVMTGMGRDGLRGCEQIHAAGGQILVQDEASSVVWGMPGFVARAGMAEQVLPLGRLGDEIIARVTRNRQAVGAGV